MSFENLQWMYQQGKKGYEAVTNPNEKVKALNKKSVEDMQRTGGIIQNTLGGAYNQLDQWGHNPVPILNMFPKGTLTVPQVKVPQITSASTPGPEPASESEPSDFQSRSARNAKRRQQYRDKTGPYKPRTNSLGVIETEHDSAQTSRSVGYTRTAAEAEKDLGITLKNPFSSIALPNTKDGDIQLNDALPKGDSGFSEDYDNYLQKGGQVSWDSDMDVNAPGKALTTENSGGIEVGEDGLPVNKPNAFLSYDGPGGALGALRAKEAESGIVYAAGGDRGGVSGNNWVRHGEKLHAISDDDKRTYMAGGDGAQALLDTWKTNIASGKSRAASTVPGNTPAETQAPPTVETASRSFKADAPDIAGGSTDLPQSDATDFDINNSPAGSFNTSFKATPSKTDWMSTNATWYS